MSTGSGFGTHYAIDEMSDANGWNKPAQYRTIRVGDVNGDGKMDVCGRAASGVRCFIFNGSGFTAANGPEFSDAGGWNVPQYYSTLRVGGPLVKTCSLQKEVCDGKDNNCNGKTDENNVCCSPSTEVCDGKDNDCDDEVDEGDVCVVPDDCEPSDEICDEKDNDCDGQVDEENVCCESSDEICDGKDNDCNGQVDEGDVCVVPDDCIPETEICDTVDNDCDGQVDEGGICGGVSNPNVDFSAVESCSAAPMSQAPHHVFGIFSLLAMLGLALRRRS
jgi:MYXO-CTERM domain-containing protein